MDDSVEVDDEEALMPEGAETQGDNRAMCAAGYLSKLLALTGSAATRSGGERGLPA